MSASIFFRASVSGCLSLTWSPVIHELICYRNLSQDSAQDRVHAVRGLGCESRSSQGSQDSVLRQQEAPSMPPTWMARGKGARPLPPYRDAGANGPVCSGVAAHVLSCAATSRRSHRGAPSAATERRHVGEARCGGCAGSPWHAGGGVRNRATSNGYRTAPSRYRVYCTALARTP
jgi:hypothetical protein